MDVKGQSVAGKVLAASAADHWVVRFEAFGPQYDQEVGVDRIKVAAPLRCLPSRPPSPRRWSRRPSPRPTSSRRSRASPRRPPSPSRPPSKARPRRRAGPPAVGEAVLVSLRGAWFSAAVTALGAGTAKVKFAAGGEEEVAADRILRDPGSPQGPALPARPARPRRLQGRLRARQGHQAGGQGRLQGPLRRPGARRRRGHRRASACARGESFGGGQGSATVVARDAERLETGLGGSGVGRGWAWSGAGCATSTEFFNEGPGQPADRATGTVPDGVQRRVPAAQHGAPHHRRPEALGARAQLHAAHARRASSGSATPPSPPPPRPTPSRSRSRSSPTLKEGEKEEGGNNKLVALMRNLHERGLKDPLPARPRLAADHARLHLRLHLPAQHHGPPARQARPRREVRGQRLRHRRPRRDLPLRRLPRGGGVADQELVLRHPHRRARLRVLVLPHVRATTTTAPSTSPAPRPTST